MCVRALGEEKTETDTERERERERERGERCVRALGEQDLTRAIPVILRN